MRVLDVGPRCRLCGSLPMPISCPPPPLGDGDATRPERPGRHEVHGDEPQGQEPHVVEAALWIECRRERRCDTEHGQRDAETAPYEEGGDGPEPGEHECPGIGLAEVLPPTLHVLVAHGRRVGVLESEGDEPPSREQQADAHGRGSPPHGARRGDGLGRLVVAPQRKPRVGNAPAGRQELDDRQNAGAAQGVHSRDDVREDAAGQHDRRPPAVSALPDGTREEAQEQDGEREAERERILPRQRREEVAAVNGERVVEEERQGGRGQKGWKWRTQAEEATTGPRTDWEEDGSEDRAHLECDVVGDDPAADRDEEVGQREVEGVEGETVVPARVPASQVAVAQQHLEVLGHRDVRARVASGGGGVREQQVQVELRDRHDDDGGDRDHGHGTGYPRRAAAGRAGRSRRWLGRGRLLHVHHVGSAQFSHVQPSPSRRGPGRPRHRCRSATSGLRYRPDLRSRARPTGPSRLFTGRCYPPRPGLERRARALVDFLELALIVVELRPIFCNADSSPCDFEPLNHVRALISQ